MGGILRLHAGPLAHRTAGRIDALITSLSLNHRTKKTTPMVAAMRKADIIRAHHIVRVRSSSESSRSIVSLHHLCQALALISILGFNCSRRDRSARQVSVGKAAARNSLKVDGRPPPGRLGAGCQGDCGQLRQQLQMQIDEWLRDVEKVPGKKEKLFIR